MGQTYTVALEFEVKLPSDDRTRLARDAERFAELLPLGSRTLALGAPTRGVATLTVSVPADAGPARALYAVASALELTAAQGPEGLDALGQVRHAIVDFEG
jgi:hypothetical protein